MRSEDHEERIKLSEMRKKVFHQFLCELQEWYKTGRLPESSEESVRENLEKQQKRLQKFGIREEVKIMTKGDPIFLSSVSSAVSNKINYDYYQNIKRTIKLFKGKKKVYKNTEILYLEQSMHTSIDDHQEEHMTVHNQYWTKMNNGYSDIVYTYKNKALKAAIILSLLNGLFLTLVCGEASFFIFFGGVMFTFSFLIPLFFIGMIIISIFTSAMQVKKSVDVKKQNILSQEQVAMQMDQFGYTYTYDYLKKIAMSLVQERLLSDSNNILEVRCGGEEAFLEISGNEEKVEIRMEILLNNLVWTGKKVKVKKERYQLKIGHEMNAEYNQWKILQMEKIN